MTKIMFFDVATATGWAFYDTTKSISSIENGVLNFTGKTAFEKVKSIRGQIPALLRQYQPDFVVLEAPLTFIPSFEKKGANSLLGEEESSRTMNPGTIMQLNRISGAVQAIVEGFNIPCEEVGPRTWQSIIPKQFKGTAKQRIRQYADSLRIIAKKQDSFDASIGCIWAAGHSQVLKLVTRAQEQLL